jgi:hypothetical protein
MPSFSMRPAKYFYDKPLPKYLDPKTVLIYRRHPVYSQYNCRDMAQEAQEEDREEILQSWGIFTKAISWIFLTFS